MTQLAIICYCIFLLLFSGRAGVFGTAVCLCQQGLFHTLETVLQRALLGMSVGNTSAAFATVHSKYGECNPQSMHWKCQYYVFCWVNGTRPYCDSHAIVVQQALLHLFTLPSLHVSIPSCLYSSMSLFLHVSILLCLYFSMSLFLLGSTYHSFPQRIVHYSAISLHS